MDKIKHYILIIDFLLLLSSCANKSNEFARLEYIDTLLYHNLLDSANNTLKDIAPQNAEDSAYYNILRTQTDYLFHQTNLDFLDINYSINYYKEHYNPQKLANAYYYKVLTYIDHDTIPKDMILLLKEAEKTSETTSDDDLKYKICNAFVYINGATGHYDEALKYANKEYYYARTTQNNRDIAYALIDLSITYTKKGCKDSAEHYIMECRKHTELVNDEDKSYVYMLLGDNMMYSQPDSAIKYFETALNYKKISAAYQNLAEIYFARKDDSTAEQYCDSALIYAWYKDRLKIYESLVQKQYDNKDIEKLKKITDKIIDESSKNRDQEYFNALFDIQKKFDFEKQEIKYVRNIFICTSIIVFLAALCIILHLKRKHDIQAAIQKKLEIENRNLQLFNELCESKIKLNNYEQNIKQLQTVNQKLAEQQDSEEYNATKKQVLEVLEKGEGICQKIKQNVCIADVSEYWIYCIFYFKTNYPKESQNIFSNYRGLTTEEKIFVIIDDFFEKKDTEIASILNISPVTVRTRRTKLKTKLS